MIQSISRRNLLKGAAVAAGASAALTAAVAHAEESPAGRYLWTASAPDAWDEECEFLIIGCGGAGACALIEANEQGMKAIGLEKGETITKCNTARSGGAVAGCCTRLQAEQGIEDDVEIFINDINKAGDFFGDQDVIRAWAEMSGDTIDWMYDMDVPFNPETYLALGTTVHSVARDYKGANEPRTGIDWMIGLNDVIQQRGYDLRLQTAGSKIYMDETGRVVGAQAMNADGSTYEIKATKGVLISTGGTGNDLEYCAKYAPYWQWVLDNGDPDNMYYHGCRTNHADGYKMLESVGAWMYSFKPDMALSFAGDEQDLCDTLPPSPAFWRYTPHHIVVDKYGKRVYDETSFESFMIDRPIFKCEGLKGFFVFDEKCRTSDVGQKYLQWFFDNYEQAGYADRLCTCDTLEEVAEYWGIDLDGLMATVDDYNARCAAANAEGKGEPDEFGRTLWDGALDTPPFYGLQLGFSYTTTKGGARVNEKAQVKNYFDEVIPGLYAAGEDSMFNGHGSAHVHIVGGCNSYAFNMGRIAARAAAAE